MSTPTLREALETCRSELQNYERDDMGGRVQSVADAITEADVALAVPDLALQSVDQKALRAAAVCMAPSRGLVNNVEPCGRAVPCALHSPSSREDRDLLLRALMFGCAAFTGDELIVYTGERSPPPRFTMDRKADVALSDAIREALKKALDVSHG